MRQEAAPASNEVAEVAPGILRVQLPINFTGLGHTNMYVLEDGDGAEERRGGLCGPACSLPGSHLVGSTRF